MIYRYNYKFSLVLESIIIYKSAFYNSFNTIEHVFIMKELNGHVQCSCII